MTITDIKIRKCFDDGPMKAVVSVTFDGALAVHDIKVINARDKFFIVMPSRKNPDGTFRDIVHPIMQTLEPSSRVRLLRLILTRSTMTPRKHRMVASSQ